MQKKTIQSGILFLAVALCFPTGQTQAQAPYFQNKTIKIVRGGEAGGTGDLQARALIPFLNPNSTVEHERGVHLKRRRHPGVLFQSLFWRLAQRYSE